MTKPKGWKGESHRHRLASMGIKTSNIKLKSSGRFAQLSFEEFLITPVYEREGDDQYLIDFIRMRDRTKMSIQASDYHYSLPKDNEGNWTHVEIKLYGKLAKRMPYGWSNYKVPEIDGLYSYVPIDMVRELIEKHGGERQYRS